MFYIILYSPFYLLAFMQINEYIDVTKDKKFIQNYFLFFILILCLIIGLRGSSDEYSRLFIISPTILNILDIPNLIYLAEKSIAVFFASIIKGFGLHSQFLLILFSTIFFYIYAKYSIKLTKNFTLVFCLYSCHLLIFHAWSGLRMSICKCFSSSINSLYFTEEQN